MASRRLLLSITSTGITRLSLTSTRCLRGFRCCTHFRNVENGSLSLRFFSGDRKGGGDEDDDDDDNNKVERDLDQDKKDADDLVRPPDRLIAKLSKFNASSDDEEDPFGLNYDDGADQLGPPKDLPPLYKRDSATGRLTGDIQKELTEEEKRLLKADPIEQDRILSKQIDKHWEKSGSDKSGLPVELDKLGERVRRSDMGLNVLGRSVKAQKAKEKLDDGSELGRDESGFTQALTPSEFESFSSFMEQKHKTKVHKEDIPVMADSGPRRRTDGKDDKLDDPDSAALSLKWLTARAQRQMDELLDDDPYSDLMPGDLSPTRLVNRKRAKPIPTKLLHHNNIGLLRRFITPTGQIANRVQSRLGARDQRRMAKLVKRARALGLIPYIGQFKAEDHGWIHAPDIKKEKEWEKELGRRGLNIKPSGDSPKRGNSSEQN